MDIFDAMLLTPLTCSFRDYLDFPSYPQSFDIAVSPDLRNSKSQGKGDRNRREKYVWCLAISHCKRKPLPSLGYRVYVHVNLTRLSY